MLRVRPILFTSHFEDYSALLTALGLACVQDHEDWRVFDSGNGKVGLHRVETGSPEEGLTQLGFEIRDAPIFVQRTVADGTHAELTDVEIGADHGPSARVTAPDGFTFLADPITEPSAEPNATAPGPLTVSAHWHTPDVDATRKVLADIGARPVPGTQTFKAKNGGLLAVHPSRESDVVLGFVYDGELAALSARLTKSGVPTEAGEYFLAVKTPAGRALRIQGSLIV